MNARTLTRVLLAGVVLAGLAAGAAWAQNPTGTLTGRVTADGGPMPGVTVTVSSDALPGGARSVVTSGSGDYLVPFLPGGTYKVTFSLDGFHTLEAEVTISVAQSRQLDAELTAFTAVTGEIEVVGLSETVSADVAGAVTFTKSDLEKLPVARTIQSATLLSPGTANNGAFSDEQINISGQPSPENLFLINGVVANHNWFGNPLDLYIEDAMEETTTAVSGISAEYGRFTGGVVNMVTKSGGNQLSGSLRVNLTNESWEGETPLTISQEDTINQVYEATLGGYIVKDRLWFFLAGRDRGLDGTSEMVNGTPFPQSFDQQRYEGKLTWSPSVSHRVMGSYLKVDEENRGAAEQPILDGLALNGVQRPQEMYALNYTGTLTENFFLEVQYSKRKLTEQFVDQGIPVGDRIRGTIYYDLGTGAIANHPFFCSECDGLPYHYNNEDTFAKGSWFLSSENLGSHELVFGVDQFIDEVQENPVQSPSDTIIGNFLPPTYGPDNELYPAILPGAALFAYFPIPELRNLSDFKNNALFVNDTWRLRSNLSLNLGLRYEMNDGVDGLGNKTADNSAWSPRLGATWDIKGDGEWLINASVARYALNVGTRFATQGGGFASLYYIYLGDPINTDGASFCSPSTPEFCQSNVQETFETMFEWFDSVGGFNNTGLWALPPSWPSVNLEIPNLNSQYSDEVSIGVVKRLGNKGLIRADYVYRQGGDFFATRVDTTTGSVEWTGEIFPGGGEVTESFDRAVRYNENDKVSREYHGIHTQFQYRFSDRLSIGGAYTWSDLTGNFVGESALSGGSSTDVNVYPEYREESWNYPTGNLSQDQRHKFTGYLSWDILSGRRHNLNLAWLETFVTGTPYGAVGDTIVSPFVQNPGYQTPPDLNSYFFTARDAYRTDDVHSTDIALNYSFFIPAGSGNVELFLQPEITNLFNENAIVHPSTAILTPASGMEIFDPFTETPVEGVNWMKAPSFGQAINADSYQYPRTFRVSLGVRF